MDKKLFMLFLVAIILVQSVCLMGETSGNEVESSIDLDAVIEEAKIRYYFYDNMSCIFNRLESLPEEYIHLMIKVLADWAEKVEDQIGIGKLQRSFFEALGEIGNELVNGYVQYIGYSSNIPGGYEEFKILFDDNQFVAQFFKLIKEYMHPHKAIDIVATACDSIVAIVQEAQFLLKLRIVFGGSCPISSNFNNLKQICEEQIDYCNQIKQDQKNLVELRTSLQNEKEIIKETVKNIEKAINKKSEVGFTEDDIKTLFAVSATLLQYKTYLMSLLEVLPNFEIKLETNYFSMSEDGTASVCVTVLSVRGFQGDVAFSADWIEGVSVDGISISGKPDWVESEEFLPQVVSLLPNESNSSIYKVSVSNFAKSGQYKIRLTANCGSYLCTQELKLIIDRIGSLRADLIISPKIIEVNQTISIEVKTYDENNSPIKDASARGWVLKPNGEKEDLILSHYPSAAKFLGKFSDTMLVGIYKVVVEISRLLYDPYIVSETFTVQTFAYTQNVYAIEDYDYELTSNLTYPYYLGDVKSAKGTIYSIYVYCPFDDCVGLEVLKNGQLMWKGALYAGDLRFFDSGELLIYISEYLFSSITKSAILVIQFGTRTGRSSITPTLQRVEAGLTCEFNIEISAEDRCAAYVYGDIRDAVEFVGVSWDIINDDKDLKRKEFCRFKPLPSSLTLRVNIPETIRLGDHYFWISILKSSISHLHDGMNPGDMFFVTLTVIPKLCSITLKSNSTMNYKNLGSITFDGTPYKLYPSGCSTLKRAGIYIVKANPPHGFIFKYWICDGGITVKNSSACSTTATVTSDGTLIAVLSPSLGSIVGRITDSITKSEINSAEIHIYSVDIEFEGFIELFVETNESGSYTITNIPSCSYVVEVSHAEGYICGELDFSRQLQKIAVVFPNCTTIINFELSPLPQLKIEPQHKIIRQGESASFNLSIILHADPSWWWCLVDSFGVLNICLGDVPLPQGIICPSSIGQIVAPDDMVKLTINSTSTAKCGSHRILIIASCGGSFYIESYIMLEIVQSDVYINTIEFFDYSFDILIESNSSIVNFDFIHLNKTVYFETSGPKSTAGYCNVTLPKTFLEGPFTVLVNETEVTYLLKETDSKSFIYFTFNNNAIVRIAGSVLLEDSEPPTIILLHSPEEIITTPMENLKIYAHVIDYQTGLANVYLIYSINGGTSWSLPIEMNKISTHTYSAELPGFSEGTYITVRIFAIDHAGNVATSTSCQFEIIPEFSSKFFVLIFMILTTLISAIIIKITKNNY